MRTLGEFRLLHPLGSGVLGRTHLAAGRDGTYHAVKELHAGWGPPAVTGRLVERFLLGHEEARTGQDEAWARHVPPSAGGYDVEAGRAWVATPWLGDTENEEGRGTGTVSLAAAVATRPLRAEAALHLVWQLAGLARRLHRRGLSLAGLTPSNLFLTPHGAVVVDVHLALVLRELLHPSGDPSGPVPRPFFLWADASWLAPELRRYGGVIRESSSIHAVGAVAAYACTGLAPLPATDLIDALTQRRAARRDAEAALARWAAHHGNAGDRLRRAVGRALRRRPWTRPGAGRLKRITVPPLWANHRLPLYRDAWGEYVQAVLRENGAARQRSRVGSGPGSRALPSAAPPVPGRDTPRPDRAPGLPADAVPAGQPPLPSPSPASTPPPAPAPASARTPAPTPAPAPAPAPTAAVPCDRDATADAPDGTSAAATAGPPAAAAGSGPGSAAVPLRTPVAVSAGASTDDPRALPAGGTRTPPPFPAARGGGPGDRTGTGAAPQPRWRRDFGGPLLCPPLFSDGRLVVTYGNKAYLYDAGTGEHHRTLALPGTAESTPVPWDGRLWWALRDGLLHGDDLIGTAGPETPLTLDGDPGRHSPVVVDDLLVAGTTHGLFRFRRPRPPDAATGQRVLPLDEPVVSPLASDGVRVWVPTERSGLLAVQPATGEHRGPHQVWDASGCAATVTEDGAYTGDAAGTVHELGSAGTEHRRWDASPHPITAAPVVHGDLLLVTDRAGTVAAQSLTHWTQQWRTPTDGDGRSPVTVFDGVVHVCGERSVRRLDARTGQELRPLTPDGASPLYVTATPGGLHVGFLDGRLVTWSRPG